MNKSEIAVLSLLAPGGLLTAEQICRDAGLTRWIIQFALVRLSAGGFVVPCRVRVRFQISERGRRALAER